MKTRLLLLLGCFLQLSACEDNSRGDPDGSSGPPDSGDGGAGSCTNACATLAADSTCAGAGLTEALCLENCSSQSCASCLAASTTCGAECMDVCAEGGLETGDFDPMTSGIDPTATSDPTDPGDTGDPTDAGGTTPDGFPCSASTECESGVCAVLDFFNYTEGRCSNECTSDGDCMLGLCCTGDSTERVTDETCVNSC